MRINDKVMTPSGVGILQGRFYKRGHQYLVVSHVVAEMTQIPTTGCLTHRAAALDPDYPNGLWIYPASEVSCA